ncbi:MAG: hypothetical protein HFG41_11965 [Coprococcus sp.]|nr:hypothetical protein [Coprococcus sp.]
MGEFTKRFKRGMALALTLVLIGGSGSRALLTAQAEEPEQEQNAGQEQPDVDAGENGDSAKKPEDGGQDQSNMLTGKLEIVVVDEELPDNDELLEGYFGQLLFGGDGSSFYGNLGGDTLKGDNKAVYDTLKAEIAKIASGERASTEVAIDKTYTWTAAELGVTASTDEEGLKRLIGAKFGQVLERRSILSYLLMDCPYEMYWYDKTEGMDTFYGYSYNPTSRSVTVSNIRMQFAVADEYAGATANTVNTSKTAIPKQAAATAKGIVAKHAGKSDYEKLVAYREEICNLVSYYDDATKPGYPYGDPWQMIWVFDGDPGTNVVCEGYAKAFQYLCDLSTFTGDTVCYTVTGVMSGGTGAGAHMWNIVTIGGDNYIVDVTNCDEGSSGSDELFLAGASGSVANGYTVPEAGNIKYTYDDGSTAGTVSQVALFGEKVLTIASEKYKEKLVISTKPTASVTYGDAVNNADLKGGKATVGGTEVPGTFSWASDVKSYGDAGTKTLKAVFTPNDTTQYEPIENIEVSVTVAPKTITPVLEITGTYTYTGQAITPTFTVKNEGVALSESDYTEEFSDNVNAGVGSVTIRAIEGGNYTWEKVTGTFTINKAVYSGTKTTEFSEHYGNTIGRDLSALLPEGYEIGNVTVSENPDGIFEGEPTVEGAVLSGKLVADESKVGSSAKITISVTETTNYEGFTITITVKVTDKAAQADFGFSTAEWNKTYGDDDFQAAASGAVAGSKVTYASSEPAVATVDQTGKVHILKPGTTVITATASETSTHHDAEATCKITVGAKALTWDVSGLSAVDKEGTVTDNKASLYGGLKVAGILKADADAGEAVFTCPAENLEGVYAGTTAGEQKVTLSWAQGKEKPVLTGAKASYYTMPANLPQITGRINKVETNLPVPPESSDAMQYKLEAETGISRVPEALKALTDKDLSTPAKIEATMRASVLKKAGVSSEKNAVVYDVVLMVKTDNGEWKEADESTFPKNGLTVTLPYPSGTGKDTQDFTVCHMFTHNINGKTAGMVEYPAVTKTDSGITFKVSSLSPMSVAWKDLQKASGAGTTSTTTTNKATAANTGDTNNIWLYWVLMLASGGTIAGAYVAWKRKCRV